MNELVSTPTYAYATYLLLPGQTRQYSETVSLIGAYVTTWWCKLMQLSCGCYCYRYSYCYCYCCFAIPRVWCFTGACGGSEGEISLWLLLGRASRSHMKWRFLWPLVLIPPVKRRIWQVACRPSRTFSIHLLSFTFSLSHSLALSFSMDTKGTSCIGK